METKIDRSFPFVFFAGTISSRTTSSRKRWIRLVFFSPEWSPNAICDIHRTRREKQDWHRL
jgi:hypothetical protein